MPWASHSSGGRPLSQQAQPWFLHHTARQTFPPNEEARRYSHHALCSPSEVTLTPSQAARPGPGPSATIPIFKSERSWTHLILGRRRPRGCLQVDGSGQRVESGEYSVPTSCLPWGRNEATSVLILCWRSGELCGQSPSLKQGSAAGRVGPPWGCAQGLESPKGKSMSPGGQPRSFPVRKRCEPFRPAEGIELWEKPRYSQAPSAESVPCCCPSGVPRPIRSVTCGGLRPGRLQCNRSSNPIFIHPRPSAWAAAATPAAAPLSEPPSADSRSRSGSQPTFVLVPRGRRDNPPQPGWLETTDVSSITLKAGGLHPGPRGGGQGAVLAA